MTKAERGLGHFWVIGRPNGQTSTGVCKKCGERREFYNSYRYSVPGNQKDPLRKDQWVIKKPKHFECIHCEIVKPFNKDYFKRDPTRRYGLVHVCLECTRAEKRQYAALAKNKARHNT